MIFSLFDHLALALMVQEAEAVEFPGHSRAEFFEESLDRPFIAFDCG
jgi:hypothetical protein